LLRRVCIVALSAVFGFLLFSPGCSAKTYPFTPGAHALIDDPQKSEFVDDVWLINTASAFMSNKNIAVGGDGEATWVPVLCALVRHKNDYILIDTGLNHHFAFKPGDYLGSFKYFISELVRKMPQMRQGQDVVAQLTRMGVTPDSISKIILTHSHLDHTGELKAFPKADVMMGPGEYSYIRRVMPELKGIIREDFPWEVCREFSFEKTKPFLTFSGHWDVYGDGTIIVVPTPGHTPGSISVFVRGKKQGFLFVGDAAYAPKNYQIPVNTGFHENAEKSWDSLTRIRDLSYARPDIRIVTFHDPALLGSPSDRPVRF
jgi:N-acyl homoserine lactone hydrolase